MRVGGLATPSSGVVSYPTPLLPRGGRTVVFGVNASRCLASLGPFMVLEDQSLGKILVHLVFQVENCAWRVNVGHNALKPSRKTFKGQDVKNRYSCDYSLLQGRFPILGVDSAQNMPRSRTTCPQWSCRPAVTYRVRSLCLITFLQCRQCRLLQSGPMGNKQ